MPHGVKRIFLLLMLLSSMLISCSAREHSDVFLSPGTVSLAGYDFSRNGILPLNCRWEFYWKKLLVPGDFKTGRPELTGYIKIPGVWNGYNTGSGIAGGDGCATYRLYLKNIPAGNYGLKLPSMATAYRLWVNDAELASNGKVSAGPDMTPQQLPVTAFFKTNGEDVILTIQVSNFWSDKGGIWEKILLGTEEQIMKKKVLAIAFDLMLFGSILIMSLYHFALYIFRKKTVFTFYFGLVCLVIALRILITGEFFLVYLVPGLDWTLEIKTEFITVFAGFAFFLLFLDSLYIEEFSRRAVKFFMAASGLFLLLTVFLPVVISAKLLPVFHGVMFSGFVYILFVLTRAVRLKREGAAYILAGCLVLTFVVVNDILDSNAIIHTGYLFPVGLLIFIFSQSVVLARIFAQSINRVEELSDQLQVSYNRIDEYNRNLESMISDRTAELAGANLKLRELDRAKTDFFANISHELRTPLTLILAPVEDALAGKRITRDSLELVHRNGRSLLFLINDLLDISRISAGRMTLEVSECDLCAIVSRCCRDMEQAAMLHGITLTHEIPGSPVNVYVDESRIIRVINNLFSNSLKFTGQGGTISISVVPDQWSGRIIFTDTGCGIPSGKVGSIFERFVQADSGTGKNHEGTGLGLSIVRDLVELHGGTVSVESRHVSDYPVGHGSIFTICIPLGVRHFDNRRDVIFTGKSADDSSVLNSVSAENLYSISADDNETVQPAPDDQPSVMIVEDNHDLRKLLQNMLSANFRVYPAGDGNEAVEMLKSVREIDLVVSDIMMPGMDGHELLQWIRSSEEFGHIPVIFLTARSDHFMKIEALELGAVDYVTKPFNSDELLLRIRNQMEQKRLRNAVMRNYERLRSKLAGTGAGDLNHLPESSGENSAVHEDSRMEQVCGFIREHYYEDITRESLAAAVDLNPDTFSRLFNQYTGRNLTDYINEYRIAEAKRKLAETDRPVTRISLEAGFDSIRTFNRVFKKHTGMNPGEFRESVN